MAKTIRGVKVPKSVLGHKLRKGTRKDIADLIKKVEHPDPKALLAAASAALVPLLAEKLSEKIKPKRVRKLKTVG